MGHLSGLSNSDIANYLSKNPALIRQVNKFFKGKLSTSKLLEALSDDLEQARDMFDHFLDARAKNIKYYSGKISKELRHAIRAKELPHNVKKAGKSLIKLGKDILSFNPIAVWTGIKLLTETTTSLLSTLPITVRERQLAVANISALGIVKTLGLTPIFVAGSLHQASASLPEPHTDLADPARFTAMQESTQTPATSVNALTNYAAIAPLSITSQFGKLRPEKKPSFNQEEDNPYLLSPYLIKKMESSAKARQYIAWIKEAARETGVNWKLHANQLFRESFHFNPIYVYGPDKSSAGAMGIAQIVKETGKGYGLLTTEDFYNPKKAIFASSRHMADLTKRFDNDDTLALIGYNGGKGAVGYLRSVLGDDVTGKEALAFLNKRYNETIAKIQKKHNVTTEKAALKLFSPKQKRAYYNESRKYADDITGHGWNPKYLAWAKKLNAKQNTIVTASLTPQ